MKDTVITYHEELVPVNKPLVIAGAERVEIIDARPIGNTDIRYQYVIYRTAPLGRFPE